MDMNRLTQKSQEALHDAQTKALRHSHTEIDGEHLLLALLDQPDGLIPRLVSQAGGDPDQIRAKIEEDLGRRPRVTGPGRPASTRKAFSRFIQPRRNTSSVGLRRIRRP